VFILLSFHSGETVGHWHIRVQVATAVAFKS
jgi:hypothetical protein